MNKNGNSHYMRVVDQLMVGQDRYVAVVQAGGQILADRGNFSADQPFAGTGSGGFDPACANSGKQYT